MGETGILHEDDRVELIDGEVIEMAPIGSRHAACVIELTRVLAKQVGEDARLSVQNPVRLDEHGEPQPDLAVVRARNYADSLPGPEDVLLLIEVADTSLYYDREVKLPLYARAGIPETWLMNLPADRLEVYRDPAPEGYRSITLVPRDGAVSPLAFPDVTIPCADLLP